jgi:hypothetical protein
MKQEMEMKKRETMRHAEQQQFEIASVVVDKEGGVCYRDTEQASVERRSS